MQDFRTEMLKQKINTGEDVLFEDDKSLDELIQEIADEEGMSFEETKRLLKKGLKEANNITSKKTHKEKVKSKKKKVQAKASRRRNR